METTTMATKKTVNATAKTGNVSARKARNSATQDGANVVKEPNKTHKANKAKTDASVAAKKTREDNGNRPVRNATKGTDATPKGKADATPVVKVATADKTIDAVSVVRRLSLDNVLTCMSEDQLSQLERWAIERRKARTRAESESRASFTPKHLNRVELAASVISLRSFLSALQYTDDKGKSVNVNINSDIDIRKAIDSLPYVVIADSANDKLTHTHPTIASIDSLAGRVKKLVADAKTVARAGRIG